MKGTKHYPNKLLTKYRQYDHNLIIILILIIVAFHTFSYSFFLKE